MSRLLIFSYLKIGLRSLYKNKAYTLLNLLGLSIGIACSLLIFLFVKSETGYDSFHTKADRTFRLQHIYSHIGALAGPAIKAEYPEVEAVTRVMPWRRNRDVLVGDNQQYISDVYYADSNFFQTFDFQFLAGDPTTCLDSPDKVVITASEAKRYFGNEPAIGQTVQTALVSGEMRTLKISAVIGDLPYNTQFHFDQMVSFEALKSDPNVQNSLNNWTTDWVVTYVVLHDPLSAEKLSQDWGNLFSKHTGMDRQGSTITYMPLKDIHLHSSYLRSDFARQGNINEVRIFSAIGILILLMASINFMNLATARSTKRAKEIGMRKVVGALRRHLVMQFIGESLLLSFFSLLLALVIIVISLNSLSNLSGINLALPLVDTWFIAISLLSVIFTTGILAGIYPALYLAGFKPAQALKASVDKRKTGGIRKVLVIFQFTISIALIIATLTIIKQKKFIDNKQLGFNSEQVISFPYGSNIVENWALIKGELEQKSGVLSIMNSSMIPSSNAFNEFYKFDGFEGEFYGETWPNMWVGDNFFDGLEIDFVMGRKFDFNNPSDRNAFILNETAWQQAINLYGDEWKEPLGKNIEFRSSSDPELKLTKKGPVVGIVKDFHHRSLEKSIQPVIFHINNPWRLMVKTDPSKTAGIIDFVKQQWTTWGSRSDFDYTFLDQEFDDQYSKQNTFASFIILFCTLAVLISCLGLLGLAAFVTETRLKEIGIRKVLGASIPGILRLLGSEFFKLIFISFLLAIPISYMSMNGWLNNFEYHTSLDPLLFIRGIVVAVLIAVLTILWHTMKVALTNPAQILRND